MATNAALPYKIGDMVKIITQWPEAYHYFTKNTIARIVNINPNGVNAELISMGDAPPLSTTVSYRTEGIQILDPKDFVVFSQAAIMSAQLMSWTLDEARMPPDTVGQPMVQKVAEKAEEKRIKLSSVVISEDKREEIKAAISQVDNSKLIFDTWGFSEVFEKGTAVTMLFYGSPGTGKTLMAQAIADEMKMDLKIYGMAEIGSSEPGGSERVIQRIFKEAKDLLTGEDKKRVILFDECDSLLYDRAKVGVILGAQINALLSEIERHEGIVIFTTNRIGTLDPALERRITAKIEFTFPTKEERLKIWERLIPSKAPIHKDVKFKNLANFPIAGGNIKNVVLNAARMAAYRKADSIDMDHFLDAIERENRAIKAFEKKEWETQSDDLEMGEGMKRTIKPTIKPKYQTKTLTK